MTSFDSEKTLEVAIQEKLSINTKLSIKNTSIIFFICIYISLYIAINIYILIKKTPSPKDITRHLYG